MRLNADFSEHARVIPQAEAWICSPESGVDRLMLDRIGDEVARATSIVRYAAGSRFSRHLHEQGEEFLVLDGIFSDETGDYPTGMYIRNPPGTGHAPHSIDGCRILVKLRQFDPADTTPVTIDTTAVAGWQKLRNEKSQFLPLHTFGAERVCMLRTAAGNELPIDSNSGGVEVFIVSGSVEHGHLQLPVESWLRFPPDAAVELQAKDDATVWVKSGHLQI